MRARHRLLPILPAAAFAAAAAAGCNPQFTRYPRLGPLPPEPFERSSQERFDPFPDDDLGPETFTRPQDYQNERGEQRKSLGTTRGFDPAPADPFLSGATRDYPGVVR